MVSERNRCHKASNINGPGSLSFGDDPRRLFLSTSFSVFTPSSPECSNEITDGGDFGPDFGLRIMPRLRFPALFRRFGRCVAQFRLSIGFAQLYWGVIDTDAKLAAYLPTLKSATWLALDTEADSLHAYPEKSA